MSLAALLTGPDFDEFCSDAASAEGAVRIPVVMTLPGDTLTPVAAYLRLREQSSHTFLFESVEGGERLARYSFVGFEPTFLLRCWGEHVELEWRQGPRAGTVEIPALPPLEFLRELTSRAPLVEKPELPRFLGGAVGFFGYDSVRLVEEVPRNNPDPLGTPDINLAIHDRLLAFDHLRALVHLVQIVELEGSETKEQLRSIWEVARAGLGELRERLQQPLLLPTRSSDPDKPATTPTFHSNETAESFSDKVLRVQEHILAGDIFQAVLSQRLTTEIDVDPFAIYRAVRILNPSPYLFYLAMGDHTLVGASPEMLVRVEEGQVQTLPIAGTRKRGATEAEDQALEEELLADPKERAEHEMLVDLGRNDLGRVARFGTVKLAEHMEVQRFSHVMHLVSRVVGELRDEADALDALYACFPAGTVSGAPKVRAMEIIEEQEKSARGVYAGAVGYLDYRGDLDSCIAIRTVVVTGRQAHVQAGAGIVYDSIPEHEYQETRNKAGALVEAIRWAQSGLLDGGDG
ncbi:MAG: anthranilate synthase component I [Myxococcota bacterium]|nr:anthranilate synthase component I [Myxococcota bacterium]